MSRQQSSNFIRTMQVEEILTDAFENAGFRIERKGCETFAVLSNGKVERIGESVDLTDIAREIEGRL
jgi:hypothetical protein